MNFKLEWNKIVINALSVLVATIIVGAACIVWDKAMSVDTKVQDSEKTMTKLVETLSEKLGLYETQLSTMSNQLAVLINNQTLLIQKANSGGFTSLPLAGSSPVTTGPMTGFVPPKSTIPDADKMQLQQRVNSADMLKQFTPRK